MGFIHYGFKTWWFSQRIPQNRLPVHSEIRRNTDGANPEHPPSEHSTERTSEKNKLPEILSEVSQQLDWSQYETICLTTSATVGARVLAQDDTIFVILGTYQSEITSSNFHEIQLQKTLEIIRSISDPSRFSIISSLLNAPADSQELVSRTSLTKANLFYHMNYLLDAKLVNADNSSHTNKYELDLNELYYHLKMFSEYLNYHLNIVE